MEMKDRRESSFLRKSADKKIAGGLQTQRFPKFIIETRGSVCPDGS